jgi:CheY-like chemotaxis protein
MSLPDAMAADRQISVFVVEDEALVALNLEDMLVDLGFRIEASAMRLEQALDIVDSGCAADVAILDVNLAGKPVFPVAERLAATGIPIVFATGYGRSGLPERWQSNQVLQKPYTMEQIAGCLNAAVGSAALR